jgi:hypothetical protein
MKQDLMANLVKSREFPKWRRQYPGHRNIDPNSGVNQEQSSKRIFFLSKRMYFQSKRHFFR